MLPTEQAIETALSVLRSTTSAELFYRQHAWDAVRCYLVASVSLDDDEQLQTYFFTHPRCVDCLSFPLILMMMMVMMFQFKICRNFFFWQNLRAAIAVHRLGNVATTAFVKWKNLCLLVSACFSICACLSACMCKCMYVRVVVLWKMRSSCLCRQCTNAAMYWHDESRNMPLPLCLVCLSF